MRKLLLATFGAAIVATGVHAQEQTPQNANLFLQRALEGAQTPVTDVQRGHTIGYATITNVRIFNECGLNYTFVYPSLPGYDYTRPVEAGFPWATYTEIVQSGSEVVLRSSVHPNFVVRLNSETLATRVVYAMEFLRMHCDPLAGTGF